MGFCLLSPSKSPSGVSADFTAAESDQPDFEALLRLLFAEPATIEVAA